MNICIYYNKRTEQIIEILPKQLSGEVKRDIETLWTQEIPRKILKTLSSEETYNASSLKRHIGHSVSTVHENLRRLEEAGLITTRVVYEGNKQRIVEPRVLCVTKNPPSKVLLQRFFQGMWTSSKKTRRIVEVLESNPDHYFSIEEMSTKTGIPVDEVELLLNNWDSQLTRGLSEFLKEPPFEKKVLYRARKKNI